MPESLDRRLAFDRDPESYDRGRPTYPDDLFDELFAYINEELPSRDLSVLEIGPGTGQATTAFLARNAAVTAVELGSRMSAVLRDKFDASHDLRVFMGAFEDVELPAKAFDLVVAATAWKWLDSTVRLGKAAGLLRPHGVLATISTIQIQSPVDRGFFERTFPIYQRYRPDELWTDAPTETNATPPEYEEFRSSALLGDVRMQRYRWDQTYSAETYEALLRSYSDMQVMDDARREGLIRELRDAIDEEFDGQVTRPLVIALTMGRRPVT
jgi:SAM-dependent methyltransferase